LAGARQERHNIVIALGAVGHEGLLKTNV
jgi:hypothetical protein